MPTKKEQEKELPINKKLPNEVLGGTPDRVWASVEILVPPIQFGGVKVTGGWSTDVERGESGEEAFERVWEVVQSQVIQKQKELLAQYPKLKP